LVYQEYQADTPDVVGIYQSRHDAEAAAQGCRKEVRREFGWVVYGDQDLEGNDIAVWDVDVHVEEHDLHLASARTRRGRG
jgi:hypothetical protein